MRIIHVSVAELMIAAVTLGISSAFAAPPASTQNQVPNDPCPALTAWQGNLQKRLTERYGKLKTLTPAHPKLAKELAERYARDQAAEAAWIKSGDSTMKSPAGRRLSAIQRANLAWLKPEVEANGFPTASQVGITGVEDAWMLVQHSSMDVAFQARVLREIKPRLSAAGYLRSSYALLYDRVQVDSGRKQRYGTQFTPVNGQGYLDPTEDMAGLEKRRAQMNLPPMADYVCELQHMYHASVHMSAPPKPVHRGG